VPGADAPRVGSLYQYIGEVDSAVGGGPDPAEPRPVLRARVAGPHHAVLSPLNLTVCSWCTSLPVLTAACPSLAWILVPTFPELKKGTPCPALARGAMRGRAGPCGMAWPLLPCLFAHSVPVHTRRVFLLGLATRS